MRTELRLALLLTRGSDRREWWRVTLTAVGAGLATGFGLAAAAVASLDGQYSVRLGNGLLDQPGERSGIVLALLLLLVPVLGFLAQCARIGAVHRDRRLAGLRLAGASAPQVRRIAALEAGLAALVGSAVAAVFSALLLLSQWQRPPAVVWAGFALITVRAGRTGEHARPAPCGRLAAGLGAPGAPTDGPGPGGRVPGGVAVPADRRNRDGTNNLRRIQYGSAAGPRPGDRHRYGGRLAGRRHGPAHRTSAPGPYHAAVLLVTVVGTGFLGIRQVLLQELEGRGPDSLAASMSFYTTGINLTGAAVLIALAITLSGLAVGTAESLATRRRGLAAQAAAGVPAAVLGRALLLETALPLAPAVALAGLGGLGIGAGYASIAAGVGSVPLLMPLLVPVAVYAACLLAAATSLPLLRRSVHPAELRYT
jgi:hypothetical protein